MISDLEIQKNLNASLRRFEHRANIKRFSPKGILFDMDGVLYDSMPAHEKSWLETANYYDLPMTTDDVYLFEGQTGAQTIEILINRKYGRLPQKEEIEEIYKMKTHLFVEYNQGDIIPNVMSVLELVRHMKPLVVTGSSQPSLIEKLEDRFQGVFDHNRIVTGLDVRKGKPDPEPYLKGVELAGLSPSECIVIENAPAGVRAAHLAGCFTIAVNTGPLLDSILWNNGADIVLKDMNVAYATLKLLLSY